MKIIGQSDSLDRLETPFFFAPQFVFAQNAVPQPGPGIPRTPGPTDPRNPVTPSTAADNIGTNTNSAATNTNGTATNTNNYPTNTNSIN